MFLKVLVVAFLGLFMVSIVIAGPSAGKSQ
jgi:hypothetical protein